MGKTKKRKVAGFSRSILAANLRALIDIKYASASNKPKAVSADSGIALSTVQRILDKDVGPSLDNIEALAGVFDLTVYQLLIPELNAKNPQIVKGATKAEERMYRNWKAADLNTMEAK